MKTLLTCPIAGCPWTLDTTPPATPDGALAEVFGWGVMAATHQAQALRRNELEAEAHLKSHSVVEWVNTVNSLREAYVGLVQQMVEMTNVFTAAKS